MAFFILIPGVMVHEIRIYATLMSGDVVVSVEEEAQLEELTFYKLMAVATFKAKGNLTADGCKWRLVFDMVPSIKHVKLTSKVSAVPGDTVTVNLRTSFDYPGQKREEEEWFGT